MSAGGELVSADLELALAAESVFERDRYAIHGVRPDHYATWEARAIVEAADRCWEAQGGVTLERVAVELQRADQLAKMGGLEGLTFRLSPLAAPDAHELKRLAGLRHMRDLGGRLMQAASRQDASAVSGLCEEIGQGLVDTAGGAPILTQLEMIELAAAGFAEGSKRKPAIYPGFAPLYDAVGDLPIGSMTVIIGNTNVSKSNVVLEMGAAVADRGVGFGLVGLEDPHEVTASRVWGMRAGVDPRDIQRGRIDEHAWNRMLTAADKVRTSGANLLFTDYSGASEVDICSAISRLAARGVQMVAVDYLQVIESSRRQQDRRNEVSVIAKRIKTHARKAGVALVLVSQITRPSDKNPNRAPTKHDAKESGDIENAAELMIGLWRDEENDYAPIRARVLKSKIGGNGAEWVMQRGKRDGRLRVVDNSELEPW